MTKENSLEDQKTTPRVSVDFITYVIALFGLALLPIFVTPWFSIPVFIDKQFWLMSLALVLLVFWLIGRMQKGIIVLPKNPTLLLGVGLLSIFLLSAIFSGNIFHSIIGSGFDYGSVLSIAVALLLLFLYSVIFDKRERVLNIYMLLFGSGILLGLYMLLVVTSRVFSFPFLSQLPLNIFGSWYGLGVFFGFISISALIILELFSVKGNRWFSYLLTSVFAFSLFILALVNYYPVWFIFGLSSLILFVYVLTFGDKSIEDKKVNKKESLEVKERRILRPSFVALLISLCFIILGGQAGVINDSVNRLYVAMEFSFVDERPMWNDTFGVVAGSLRDNFFLGVGPNNFNYAWANYKPDNANLRPYWNQNFLVGTGLIPTFFANTGVLGVLVTLLFIFSLFFYGFKGIFNEKQDDISRLVVFLLFAGNLYLWTFAFLYAIPAVLLGLTFIVSGLLIAQLSSAGVTGYTKIYLSDSPRFSFLVILSIVVLLLVGVAGGYFLVQKYWAAGVFYKNLTESGSQSLSDTSLAVGRAIRFDPRSEVYYQSLVLLSHAQIMELIQRPGVDLEEISPAVERQIQIGSAASLEAARLNTLNHQNFVLRADFLWFLLNLGVADAGPEAMSAINRAIALSPKNPTLYVAKARVAFALDDMSMARLSLEKALDLKSNYTQALFILAQLDLEEGLTDSVIARAEEAIVLAPNDPAGFFQLGYLHYRLGDFSSAVQALERSIALSPGGVNANSQYFLGLSYAELGNLSEAIDQFEIIRQYNPDHVGVQEILGNLRAGRPALGAAAIEESVEPEIELELPIEEE